MGDVVDRQLRCTTYCRRDRHKTCALEHNGRYIRMCGANARERSSDFPFDHIYRG